MGDWIIDVLCGGCKAGQKLVLRGITRLEAETFAGILDGTSPLYAVPVPEDSTIGQCGICGGRFKAKAKAASGTFEPGVGGGV